MSVFPRKTDDCPACLGNGGGSATPVRAGPVVGNEPSMPTQQRVRLHYEDGPSVTAEDLRERSEDGAVVGFEAGTDGLALQHSQLVTQHEDLDIFGTICLAA